MRYDPDRWLASIFGYEVFRLTLEEDEVLDPRAIFPTGLPSRAFYFAKVATTSVAQVSALTEAGFSVVDVNITFERKAAPLSSNVQNSVVVRDAMQGDEAAVLDVAETCFVYSRFHLDPLISKDLAGSIKRQWIANYFDHQRGERLLVAECSGKPVGFLAVLSTGKDGNLTHVIDLIGVDNSYQGQGVGVSLVQFFINTYAGQSRALLVGTQAANIPSMRLYERFGFSVVQTAYVLHAHVKNGELVR